MKPLDDESLLSGYLDNELDPARRLQVEAALLSSPELAEQLQALSGVRGLLGGMARPVFEGDVSAAVVGSIAVQERRLAVRLRALATTAAAACLLVCAAVASRLPQVPPRSLAQQRLIAPRVPGAAPAEVAIAGADPAAAATEPVAAAAATAVADAAPVPAATWPPLVDDVAERPRRLVVVIDRLSPELVTRVEGALLEIGRAQPLWGEIAVGAKLAVDPVHPNDARVFALRMDDAEAGQLERELAARLPEASIALEAEAPAELSARLASLPEVRIGEGRATTPLRPAPGEFLAQRIPGREPGEVTADAPAPLADLKNPAPTPPRLTLVWVTTSAAAQRAR